MAIISVDAVCEVINGLCNIQINSDYADVDLAKLGVDSIVFIRIILELEKQFTCTIPDEMLLFSKINTVNKIVALLTDLKNL